MWWASHLVQNTNVISIYDLVLCLNSFVASEPPKFWGSPNIFFNQILFTFFQLLKSFNCENFYWLTNKNFFSQQKVNIQKLTADISLKKYLVIHQILVVWMPWISYLFLLYSRKGLDLFYSLLFQWEYFWCLNLLVLLLFASTGSRRVHVSNV